MKLHEHGLGFKNWGLLVRNQLQRELNWEWIVVCDVIV